MRSTSTTSRFVRPMLETLETRDLLSAASGFLLTQPLGQIATMMSNAESFLASDLNNLNKDLGNVNVPGSVSLQDYAKAGFDYGQIQGFNQAMTTLGKADMAFLLFSSSGSSQSSSALMSLLNINSDIKKANNDLVHAMSLANKNPPGDFLAQGFESILTAVS